MSLQELLADKYSFEPREIGSGGQGKVYKGVQLSTNLPVAIKKIRMTKESHIDLEREIANLRQVTSPYIVKCLEVMYLGEVEEGLALIVMEYLPGGSLSDYLRANKCVDQYVAHNWMQQLVLGLNEVWEQNILHRDIKPANILLTQSNAHAEVRICDFGVSKNTAEGAGITNLGTPLYKAPEIDGKAAYDSKVDIYSLGLVYLDMLVGPASGSDQQVLLRLHKLHNLQVESFSEQLIRKMLEWDPTQRINQHQLLFQFRYSNSDMTLLHHNEICEAYKVRDLIASRTVVLKCYSSKFPECCKIEAAIVSEKEEAGVISFLESFQNCLNERQVLVLEYLQGGTLHDFLAQNAPVNELVAKSWMRSLLLTVGSLHSREVVLRNLAPSNIALDSNSLRAQLKLCDFELAAKPNEWGVSLEHCRENLAYWAPELQQSQTFSTASDVWSLGCVFLCILTGKLNFQAAEAAVNAVLTAEVTEDCVSLLQGMLAMEAASRFTVADCLNHAFFTSDPLHCLTEVQLLPKYGETLTPALAHIRKDMESGRFVPAYVLTELVKQLYTKSLPYYLSFPANHPKLTPSHQPIARLSAYLQPFAQHRLTELNAELYSDPVDIGLFWFDQIFGIGEVEQAREFLTQVKAVKREVEAVDRESFASRLG